MKHIALVFGGPTPEHDVSLVSAKNVLIALKESSYQVSLIGITRTGTWKKIEEQQLASTSFVEPLDLNKCGEPLSIEVHNGRHYIKVSENPIDRESPIDVAFPVIHGPYGEDGVLQSEFNKMGLGFVGTDEQACINTFDKVRTKEIISKTSIPQVPYISFTGTAPAFADVRDKLGLPFFIKPANMGSSIGISKVSSEATYDSAIKDAQTYDKKIIIEQSVTAREIECAILNTDQIKASGLGEVKPNHDFYSYEAKYLDPNGAELIIPAILEPKIKESLRNMAIECFEALECRDYARADFFLTKEGDIFFNEINTYPGFTSISQFPLLWKQEGIAYKDLISELVENAIARSSY